MAYKYIYIDDIADGTEQGIINGIESGGTIKVEFMQPHEWDNLIDCILKIIQDFNGLILDLRLNDNPNKSGYTAKYRGTTVAQELRTLTKEGKIPNDFPILLISANENIDTSLDDTGKDLFDALISKTDLGVHGDNSFSDLKNRLIDLAEGYKFLNNTEKEIQTIFAIDSKYLDFRFVDIMNQTFHSTNHTISRFIIRQILERPSFLINEDYLSARLGIDKSSENWGVFKTKYLEDYRYTGVYSNYYQRWWMPLIELWWKESTGGKLSLRNTSSEEKSTKLKELTGLSLHPIVKLEKSKSNSFWTICKATKAPIDTLDGFVIDNQDDLFPWQEKEYVSIEEALRPTRIDLWKSVAPIEKARLSKLKDFYSHTTQRKKS